MYDRSNVAIILTLLTVVVVAIVVVVVVVVAVQVTSGAAADTSVAEATIVSAIIAVDLPLNTKLFAE